MSGEKRFKATIKLPVELICEDIGEVRGSLVTRFCAIVDDGRGPKHPLPRLEAYSSVRIGTSPRAREEADRQTLLSMGIMPDTVRDEAGDLVIA